MKKEAQTETYLNPFTLTKRVNYATCTKTKTKTKSQEANQRKGEKISYLKAKESYE
jgi:hypothetical protein